MDTTLGNKTKLMEDLTNQRAGKSLNKDYIRKRIKKFDTRATRLVELINTMRDPWIIHLKLILAAKVRMRSMALVAEEALT
jgi:hypothetical protein